MNRIVRAVSDAHSKGYFALLTSNLLTQSLGFGTSLLVVRLISPAELGSIRILQSYGAFFVVLAGFGYNTAALRYCSGAEKGQIRTGLMALAIRRSLWSSGLALLVFAACAMWGGLVAVKELRTLAVTYALTVPAAVLTQLLICYLQALKRIKDVARAQIIIKTQSLLLIVLATWCWGINGFILSTVIAYLAGLVPLMRQVKLNSLFAKPAPAPAGFDRMAVLSALGNGAVALGASGQFFLLDHFYNDRQGIGYYSLATIMVSGVCLVTSTAQAIATPYMSERSSDWHRVAKMLVNTQARICALSVAVAVGAYAGSWVAIPLLFGAGYKKTLTYLAPLLLKYILWSCASITGVALLSIGKVHLNLIAAVLSMTVCLGASYFALTGSGLLAMAWAQALSETVGVGTASWMAWRVFSRATAGVKPPLGMCRIVLQRQGPEF